MSSLFFRGDTQDEISETQERVSMSNAPMGTRIDHLGRYKMPLLPGEQGTKGGGDWVPRGLQSATNLAGAIVETYQLGKWERERSQIGLGLRPDLAERLAFATRKALATGADFNERTTYTDLAAELELIHKEAKQTAGGNAAAQAGTNRHDVWESAGQQATTRPDASSLFGTPEINDQIERMYELLERKGLQRVPGLQERTVRNVHLRCAGRFDDVLIAFRDIPAMNVTRGTLLMADLKTKKRPFWSWLEARIQLAVYATAEYMLDADMINYYVPGPKHHVSQEWGVIMRMPADGGEPELRRCNLRIGLQHAELARAVCDARSEGKSVAAHQESVWLDVQGELEGVS